MKQNNQNILKEFLKRLIFTVILLSVVSTSLIYYVQKDKFYNNLAKEITKHVNKGLKKYNNHIKISQKNFVEHIKMIDFVLFELYDDKQNELYGFAQTTKDSETIKLIEKYHIGAKHHFPTNKETYYDFFEVPNKQYFLLVFYPIYKDNKLLGYIEGIKTVDNSIIKKFEKKIIYTISTMLLAILIFSLFVFPLIYLAYKKLNQNRIELISNNIMTINTLGNAIALRDSDTNEHNYRVSIYSIRLAQEINLEKNQMKKLIIGAFLHDIGKIGITDTILLKNGKLTNDEFEIMKQHVQKGVKLIENNKWLENGKDVILYHHEKYDGRGYPNKIAGDQIPKIARIFTIVDVFDALTSKRPYKEPFSYEKAINMLSESSGTHFDPLILKSFIKISKKLYNKTISKSHKQLKDELDGLITDCFLE